MDTEIPLAAYAKHTEFDPYEQDNEAVPELQPEDFFDDPYADFVQCGECAEWHSESLGCHKCRLLKRSYAIEGLEEAELRLLIDALPPFSGRKMAELRQMLVYKYNEVVAESFDGWPEPDYGDCWGEADHGNEFYGDEPF